MQGLQAERVGLLMARYAERSPICQIPKVWAQDRFFFGRYAEPTNEIRQRPDVVSIQINVTVWFEAALDALEIIAPKDGQSPFGITRICADASDKRRDSAFPCVISFSSQRRLLASPGMLPSFSGCARRLAEKACCVCCFSLVGPGERHRLGYCPRLNTQTLEQSAHRTLGCSKSVSRCRERVAVQVELENGSNIINQFEFVAFHLAALRMRRSRGGFTPQR